MEKVCCYKSDCSSSGGLLQAIAPEYMPECKFSKLLNNSDTTEENIWKYSETVIGTWNVRSLSQPGKLENVLQEMVRMKIDILGIAETFLESSGEFEATLPGSDERFRVHYSGGDKKRKGVAFILRGHVKAAEYSWHEVSERIICLKLKCKPVSMIILQVYAPTSDATQAEVEEFYEQIEEVVKVQKKYGDCLIVMGDFNGKVGEVKESDTVGPFGLGQRNENGQRVIECCQKHNLMVANTWFQSRENTRHTWISPDGTTKNQIDYVLVEKRFRNGVKNCKARLDADCGSDHNPVLARLCVKLQKSGNNAKVKSDRWNTERLKDVHVRDQFTQVVEDKIDSVVETEDINLLWQNIKSCIVATADQVCGKHIPEKRQKWMTDEILQKMEARRKLKNDETESGQRKYKDLKHEVQRLCRQACNAYYKEKCDEIEHLEATHNPMMYKKIKEMTLKRKINGQSIKDKDGNLLSEPQEILERWAQYVEELYNDNRGDANNDLGNSETCSISEMEIKSVIQKLSSNKAITGADNIPAEFLQTLGENGIQVITRLINKIYNTGIIPDDFLTNVFITIPKVSRAQDCSDFRTISLISHTSKILLHLINNRITPIIERHLSDSQMGFRKGRGTRDAIFQFRTITERAIHVNKKVFACFVDYQKAFDRINHEKLLHIMEKAGIPELERKLIRSLYWNQYAVIRTTDGISRKICIRRGVRQGCIISPILFNLYSEYMMLDVQEKGKGIVIGGQNFTNLRYADDAVVISEEEAELQQMITTISDVCKEYGMEINVKKTKTMAICKTGNLQCKIMINGTMLEQVPQYKYLGSWITEDGKCDYDIKTRIGIAKDAFWKHKELLKGSINLAVKQRILHCYVFPVAKYSCESWTLNKELSQRINAFEYWCYRRLLKIKWTDMISNEEVLRRMKIKESVLYNSIVKQKLAFAGHVLRGSSGDNAVQILEGKLDGKIAQGRPRRMWIDDIKD